MRPLVVGLAVLVGALALRRPPPREPRVGPRYFAAWDDAHRVVCSLGMDRSHTFTPAQLLGSLDYAAGHALVLHSNGHAPTLDLESYAPAFAYAHAHGVPTLTYRELAADRTPRPGWAISIDDNDVDTWFAWRARLRELDVHVTFFVSGYEQLSSAQRAELRALAADGHDIEAHGRDHIDARAAIATRSIADYIADQITPETAQLAADGFAPVAFAYPFGTHTPALDRALLTRFQLLRTTAGANCY